MPVPSRPQRTQRSPGGVREENPDCEQEDSDHRLDGLKVRKISGDPTDKRESGGIVGRQYQHQRREKPCEQAAHGESTHEAMVRGSDLFGQGQASPMRRRVAGEFGNGPSHVGLIREPCIGGDGGQR